MAVARTADSIAGFIELHIEQGPKLEDGGKNIGVVDAIFGRRSMNITFTGHGDHAGTTPMRLRAEALVAASLFVTKVDQIICCRFRCGYGTLQKPVC